MVKELGKALTGLVAVLAKIDSLGNALTKGIPRQLPKGVNR